MQQSDHAWLYYGNGQMHSVPRAYLLHYTGYITTLSRQKYMNRSNVWLWSLNLKASGVYSDGQCQIDPLILKHRLYPGCPLHLINCRNKKRGKQGNRYFVQIQNCPVLPVFRISKDFHWIFYQPFIEKHMSLWSAKMIVGVQSGEGLNVCDLL